MTERTQAAGEASRRLLAAGERELQRIVLDMHDGPVQDIFAAVSHLQLLQRDLTYEPEAARRAGQAAALLERALGEIRTLIGLTVQHEAMTDQPVECSLDESLGDCSLPVKIALYRILQEALANGHRHAGATRQTVSVERRDGSLRMVVSDNGRGFDFPKVLAREADVGVEGGHFGLRGIQDRVAMLGGRFEIDSAPGAGTVLTFTVPADA